MLLKIIIQINDYEFDYEKFWKKRYKKILGSPAANIRFGIIGA